MLKIQNIQNLNLNGKPATVFSVYQLRDNTWVHDYTTSVAGHWKKAKTIATKHCQENGRNINLNDWEF